VSLVERCLLRPWPGNVRELVAEIRTAAQAAADDGDRVMAHHLPASAGTMLGSAMPVPGTPSVPPEPAGDRPHRRMPQVDDEWRRRIEDGLRANAGNVSAAARALGLHRTQLRRLIERHGILAEPAADDRGDGDAAD
jgi:transcriptional regulator with GAF, ATPase, and Fis domain